MITRLKVLRIAASAVLAIPFVIGCSTGPAMGDVSGTVTVNGEVPAAGSSINFIPTDGKGPSAGCTLENGKYAAKVSVGPSKVELRVPRPVGGKKAAAGPGPGPGATGFIEESLPPEYNEKTTLTLDVKAGRNEKNWEIKTK